ncbi:MAG: lasso peptide biosynthesis B2 protein [Desulfomonilaceae bacterium]|nr:lasso peptide biosynthesis B2 protein [Desulfomonilaceae bacterium]
MILAASLAACLTVSLRLASLRTVLAASRKLAPVLPRRLPGTHRSPDRIVWAVSSVVGRVPVLGNCLAVALTTKLLLAMAGHPSLLRIGVAKDESGRLAAHAWLEDRGTILIGSPEHDRYTPLPIFDGAQE